MRKFNKWMVLPCIALASSMLVSCGDDDFPEGVLGALGVNSIQTTSNSASIYWTIVSNGSVDGYKIVINEGTRENLGAEVVNQTFDDSHVAHASFTGLKPNTSYVVTTQGIPSASSGFNSADTYSKAFMTAPLITDITYGTITYREVDEKDASGDVVKVMRGSVTATWPALTSNAAGYTAALYKKNDEGAYDAVGNVALNAISKNSATFNDVIVPEAVYRIGVRPNPGNDCWYAAGEFYYTADFTSPAAQ